MYRLFYTLRNFFSKKYLCKAPFNSIYISGDGSVTPCCFNRSYILGNIYETQLYDILSNSKTLEIRKSIQKGILPDSCKICKNQIKNGNKANSGIVTFKKFPVQKNLLSVIEFELSYACNLRCTMCKLNEDHLFVNSARTGITKFGIINQITPYIGHVKLMRFYGGEPFFIEEYYPIWKKVIEINPACRFIIQTNGTIYNDKIKDITCKGFFNFNMSLDSLDKKIYESIRIGADFEKSMLNLFRFKGISEKTGQTMIISVCPMRINWKEIPLLVEFCNKNKLYIFFNTVTYPWNLSLWSLPKNELSDIVSYYTAYTFHSFSYISFINNQRWKSFTSQVSHWQSQSQKRPYPTLSEIESLKIQVLELLKKKLSGIPEDKIKEKAYALLTDLIHFLPSSVIIDKIDKSDSNTIYNNFWLRKNEEILESFIDINYQE